MKIGILSMQKVINYGSFLQSYALKKTIESEGHQVDFVDIRTSRNLYESMADSAHKPYYVVDKDILKRIHHVLFYRKRKHRFINEFFPTIGIDKPVKETDCDMIVIGSDEVFNCCQNARWGFSRQLMGDTYKPAISYAGSFGHSDYSQIEKMGIKEEVAESLLKFKSISVRDENSSDCVNSLIGKVPYQHLDPVFIYDWDLDVKKQTKYKDYILVYSYDNRINKPEEIKAIKAFAKKHNKKLLSFGVYQRWCDKNILCTPLELIAYFDSADYVITDTFHGTVISIKRNKKFATIIRESNRNKLSDLLSKFNLNHRLVETMTELDDILVNDIDYSSINNTISREKDLSLSYLRENLYD